MRSQLAGHLALTSDTLHAARAAEIARAFPEDGILEGEPRLADRLPRGRYTWILDDTGDRDDPARAVAASSVSVGVLRDGMPFAGAVYDPVTCWLFTACVGRGAWLNDRPLYAARALRSPRALITLDAPRDEILWPWRGIRIDGGRRHGSIALRLCYVAQGGVDAVHDPGVSLIDIAGAAPIVMEAGGLLTGADGTALFPHWPGPALSARVAIVAGNPTVHRAFTEALRGRHASVTRSADTPAR